MALTANCYDAYVRAPDAPRRTFNQAFFRRILFTRDESVEGELSQPFATIITTAKTNSGRLSGRRDAAFKGLLQGHSF